MKCQRIDVVTSHARLPSMRIARLSKSWVMVSAGAIPAELTAVATGAARSSWAPVR